MICNGNICPKKYKGEDIYEQSFYDIDEDEFIKSLKHEKCKLIQLVRQQIRKFEDFQYKSPLSLNGWQTRHIQKVPDIPHNMYKDKDATEDTNKERNTMPNTLIMGNSTHFGQAWGLRTLRKIRERICIIMFIAGLIALLASFYGIYFRAYLCNSGKSCVTTLRYTHAKHTLF